jgi:hypothetical protein
MLFQSLSGDLTVFEELLNARFCDRSCLIAVLSDESTRDFFNVAVPGQIALIDHITDGRSCSISALVHSRLGSRVHGRRRLRRQLRCASPAAH